MKTTAYIAATLVSIILLATAALFIYCKVMEYRPKESLALAISMDGGRFYAIAVAQKEKDGDGWYRKRIEYSYFSDHNDSIYAVIDSLNGGGFCLSVLANSYSFFDKLAAYSLPDNNMTLRLSPLTTLVYTSQDSTLSLYHDAVFIDRLSLENNFEGFLQSTFAKSAYKFIKDEYKIKPWQPALDKLRSTF